MNHSKRGTLSLNDIQKFKGFLKRTGWDVKKKEELNDYEIIRAHHPIKKKWFIAYAKTTAVMHGTVQKDMMWVVREFLKDKKIMKSDVNPNCYFER